MNQNQRRIALPIAAIGLLLAACGSAPTAAPAPTSAATTAAQPSPTPEAQVQPTATTGAVPTQAPAVPTVSPPSQDDLAKSKAAGKLLVGTAADYPPFEFYNADYEVDGFDIALIKDLSKRAGVPNVEVTDFAFDGLLTALQLGQVDAAIAALSVTPDRQQIADFTNIYYIGEDAFLGASDSQLSVTSPNDLAGKRIGAQKGSVYEAYIQNDLVEPGIVKAEDVQLFGDVDTAVRDLRDKRIDVVMLDQLPAEAYVKEGGVKVIGQDLNKQQLAIAVRRGSDDLRDALNDALVNAQNDGTVQKLIGQYLKLDQNQVQPVPDTPVTPAQPDSTVQPPPCLDGMTFVSDVTYPDGSVVQPGQGFNKVWRIANTGTCEWTTQYSIVYVQGARMGGQNTNLAVAVKPGEQYDITLPLVAPAQPGNYQGVWQLANANGQGFGQVLWVRITVPGQPTPTPVPPQTPVPGINFSVNTTSIPYGSCVTFSWSVQGVQGVWFYPDGQPYQNYGVAGVSSQTVCPQTTTTYDLRVEFNDGSTTLRQITVQVTPPVNPSEAAQILQFSVTPSQITPGQCVFIQWNVGGPVQTVNILKNGVPFYNSAPFVGSSQDCLQVAGTYAYEIDAINSAGIVRQTQTVFVGLLQGGGGSSGGSSGGGSGGSSNPTPSP